MMMPKLVIVTGLSGAGKTQAMRCLEDLGFFCVDNLPPTLIPKFAELCAQAASKINKIALAVDIGRGFSNPFEKRLTCREVEPLRKRPMKPCENTKVQGAPSSQGSPGSNGKRSRLQDLRGKANKIIDTSNMAVQQLKEEIAAIYAGNANNSRLHITVISFGYKYGIPLDSDLVFDVRFLPNPHYDPALRPLSGNERPIRDYVFGSPPTEEFMEKFQDFIEFLIPQYIKEGKTTLMIAIGCTGGMHRSVVLANRLGEILESKDLSVTVRHRDIKKNRG